MRVLALLAIVIVLATTLPITMSNTSNADNVTAVTYTIRYGYDNRWRYALEDMARAIEQSGADVVTLQEVDTGRLTSLGADDVYYLARRLNMHSYYLPRKFCNDQRNNSLSALVRGGRMNREQALQRYSNSTPSGR